jgi:PAS domain S-box-containing protein
LFIDDDSRLLEVTKEYLENVLLMRVDTASDLEEAKKRLDIRDYDAVLCDYDLGGANGIDLLRHMRAGGSYVPFILFTGKGGEQVAAEALNSGADMYLQKGRELSTTFSQLSERLPVVITRRIEEENIRQSERRLRYLMENMGEVLLQVSGGGKVDYASPSVARVFGYTPGEVVGRSVTDFAAAEDLEDLASRISDPSCPDGACHIIRVRHKQGGDIWFETSGTPLKDENGQPAGALLVGRDVSARQEALVELKGSDDIFRSLTEAIPDVVISTDLNGRIIYANDALAELLQMPMNDLLGQELWRVLPREAKESLRMDGVTEVDGTIRREIKVPLEGEERVFDFTVAPMWRERRHSGTLYIAHDVTMRRREEQELRLANNKLAMMQELTRHDLLNQVSAISGYVDLCDRRSNEDATHRYMERSRKAVENMNRQLAFAREYQALGIQEPEWQSLESVMLHAVEAFDMGDVEVVIKVDGLVILADPLLEKVLFNLVENSIRHGGKVTRISLTKERKDGELLVIYQDDGRGIPAGDKQRIFRRGIGEHTGFGLYAAREVLSLTGMTIVENGDPGKGARFTITVPDRSNRAS